MNKQCPNCQTLFSGRWKYCSDPCVRDGLRFAKIGDKNPNWKGGPVGFVCGMCQKKFSLSREEIRMGCSGKFCSGSCYQEHRSVNRVSGVQTRLHGNVSGAIRQALGRCNRKKNRKILEVLSFSIVDLMAHLESQFLPGMSWDNYGYNGWHMDHVVPVSAFSFESMDDPDFRRCWDLMNLRPLWGRENISRGGVNRWRQKEAS